MQYLVPEGYSGVLVTIYNQKGYPALPVNDGYIVHDYPKNGIIITSSNPKYGWGEDQTLDRLADGSTILLPSHHTSERRVVFSATGSQSGGGNPSYCYYFSAIGDENYWKDRDAKEYEKKLKEAIQQIESDKELP